MSPLLNWMPQLPHCYKPGGRFLLCFPFYQEESMAHMSQSQHRRLLVAVLWGEIMTGAFLSS